MNARRILSMNANEYAYADQSTYRERYVVASICVSFVDDDNGSASVWASRVSRFKYAV